MFSCQSTTRWSRRWPDRGRTVLYSAVLAASSLGACATVPPSPTPEMTRAESAIEQAQRAGAPELAPQPFQAAERLQLTELQGRHTDRGVVVTLGDVLFATGRSELQQASHRSIGKLTAFLAAHPQRTVRVEGFTDNLGGAGYNRNLSEQRAASVTDALTHGGVDRSRIQTEGYGKAFPVADNDTAIGRQQNRRVEVIISDNDERVPERVAESVR
jgi:outer membrane protein OmpA-like peptidoglycan-associated protein